MKNIVDFLTIAEKLECEYRLTRMSDGMPQAVALRSGRNSGACGGTVKGRAGDRCSGV